MIRYIKNYHYLLFITLFWLNYKQLVLGKGKNEKKAKKNQKFEDAGFDLISKIFFSTIKELFDANKKLFEGLEVYDKWDWEDKYLVIKIDFNGDLRTPKQLKNRIHDILINNQKRLKVECEKVDEFDSCFEELIEKSYEKYQKLVVILIDT